ncbi:hypothetical protein C8F01DRAFT_1163462 [Mycena amicta]|nr:hypothetical protein C8F01DRAFT_1163462 [Mycena amicta]
MLVSSLFTLLAASATLAVPLERRDVGSSGLDLVAKRAGSLDLAARHRKGAKINQAAAVAAKTVTVTVTVTADCGATTVAEVVSTTNAAQATTTKATATTAVDPNAPIKVSGAGGTLNPTAVAESQKKDLTATRAVSGVTIKDSAGQCLSVDVTTGDFRENLVPVQLKNCDGSDGQKWDFITSGAHNNAKDSTLIVSSLINGCLNFDDRRAAGDQVILFSCGGRADGEGQTTNSQLFPFPAGTDLTKPYVLSPENSQNKVCFVDGGKGRLDNTACDATKPAANQLFTIGGASAAPPATSSADAAKTTTIATKATTTAPPATTTKASTTTTGPIAVSGAKGFLEPSAVAESQAFDNTATRSATGGKCLSVDITQGDFRENLIPVQVLDCDGSEGQKWDFITKGKHNNAQNSALIVSSLMNGCLNFDDRRAAGDQVIMFSCGGRADGDSQTTDSQLFPFTSTTDLTKPYVLAPENGKNAVCLVTGANGRLGNEACDATKPSGTEQFTIVA